MRRALGLALLLAALTSPAHAWRLVEVIDGDTVRITVSGGNVDRALMRLSDIDAPEKNSKCLAERQHAKRATDRLFDLLAPGSTPWTEFGTDRYGRWVGWIRLRDGRDAGHVLISDGLARSYDGKTARKPWCDAEGRLIP